ncbi:MAG: ABC transporter ATP-binding protein [Anaeroplasma sp.]|uniref:ABC transporter ATP-binding protein n=1 Tax=Anaeroplasma sp. TaxID=1872523 RepID=UPI002A91F8DC|nr:ABC transporter ATP-binding protein [Anaeroplasma sp.]MDY5983321.1 ABC transporter ATP-binding protein [Anaeroplasma sp.]
MKITINNLTKIFPARKKTEHEVTAVNDMCIEIPSGKLVGLLGPSGCGKSTTLFMLSGLEEPTSGSIYFGDDDVTDLAPEKRGIGLVFQNYALYPHMTVEQNIMFPLTNMRIPKEEAKQRALEVAGLVQIEELMGRKPSELSGGQQQRVAIARALVKMPNVLLLDEPLSNLDARLRLQTREEIKRIQVETGITTVFVTHDQEEAMSICDIMVVMKLGVVQQIGEPQAIYDDPANLFVANFLGTPPINIFTGYIHDGGVYIGNEKIADYDKDLTEKYTANIKALQDKVEAKHNDYLAIKNLYDEKTAGMEKEKAEKAHKKLFVELKAKEAEYENMVTKIADLEQAIKTKTFKIFVGIRPEGFIYDPNGVLSLKTNHVEVMGRDKTIVSVHEESVKPTVRTIVEADLKLPEGATSLKFNLKPNKFFLFDGETEERLR